MADNTCYRVTVADDGALCGEAIAFRACYADNQANALMRLHSPHLQPPIVPAADWPALLAAWEAERGAVAP